MRLAILGRNLALGVAGFGLAAASAPATPPSKTQPPKTEQSQPAAPAPPAAAAHVPRPAIWLLEDADTRIYLFGTTHIFERGFRWRSERLDRVISEADELVMETVEEEGTAAEEQMIDGMFLDKPVPILDRISPDRREALEGLIARSGLPVEMWDSLETFAAGFMMVAVQMNEATGGAPEAPDSRISGAETELTEIFRARSAPISAVETAEAQMALFRAMSREGQRDFLDMMVDSSAMPFEESGLTGDVQWATGNLGAIENEFEGMPRELYDVLLTRRNRAWTEWLQARLDRPGTVLFAVGVGHLVGPDSVQNMLAARGLTARRIE